MAIHDDTLDPTDIVMKAILDYSKVDLKESSTAVEGIPTKKERDEHSYLNKIKQSLIGKSSKANPIVHKSYAELVGEPHPDGWDYPFTKGKTWFESDDWDADMQQYIPSINPLVVVNHNVMWTLLLAREFNRPSLLVGPPGSSKDTMAKYCHAICNVPEMSFTGHRMLDSDKLI